jgi:pimeloyl-ACP methyl ester carboxylesterase
MSEDPDGARALFADPSQRIDSFVAHPFPSDALLRGGGIDLRHFPNPTQSSTLEDYLSIISAETDGFGVSTPMYLGFSDAIDTGSLDDAVRLVDVDPDSPERGRRFPLTFQYREERTLYLPPHTLAILVPFGIPLRPSTTYALIATEELDAEASAGFHNGLRDACRESAPDAIWSLLEPLRTFLEDDVEGVIGGTVFTTQDALSDLRELAEVARAFPAPELRGLAPHGYRDGYYAFAGHIELPAFQEGRVPYRAIEDGGAFARDAEGRPAITHVETTSVALTVPLLGSMPERGWPVVLYAHGTGGSYESVLNEDVANVLGQLGLATIGYDQTLHGPRDPTKSDPRLTFFNLFNPIAARDNIRQGAADAIVMTNLIEALQIETDRGLERFDPERIAFLGHSQGSLTGALFAAVDERPKAFVFSGLGAILSITLQERKDILDFAGLLRTLLAFPPEEPLDDFHPVLGLIETFIERADPIAYAKSYLGDPPSGANRDLLVVEGFLDFASPARGQEAFATASGFPVVAPVHRIPAAAMLVGPEPQEAPARENVDSASGRVTAGLLQYPEDDHYPIFDNPDATRRYSEFLRSALMDGRATIVP